MRSIKSLSFTESCRVVQDSKRNLPTRLGVLLLNDMAVRSSHSSIGRSGISRYRINECTA